MITLKSLLDKHTSDAANVILTGVMSMIETLPAVVDTGGSYEDGYRDALTDVGSVLARMQAALVESYQHED